MSKESSPQQKSASNALEEHFASFAARVEKIDQAIDVNDPQSLITARDNLAEIVSELEKLHVDEVFLFDLWWSYVLAPYKLILFVDSRGIYPWTKRWF